MPLAESQQRAGCVCVFVDGDGNGGEVCLSVTIYADDMSDGCGRRRAGNERRCLAARRSVDDGVDGQMDG